MRLKFAPKPENKTYDHFTPISGQASARAVVDISKPCQNESDFAVKTQALAGLVARMGVGIKELINDPRVRREPEGSINISARAQLSLQHLFDSFS